LKLAQGNSLQDPTSKITRTSQALVAHAYNPSYSILDTEEAEIRRIVV
jgi:hypothetical protein